MFKFIKFIFQNSVYCSVTLVQKLKLFSVVCFILFFIFHLYFFLILEQVYGHLSLGVPYVSIFVEHFPFIITDSAYLSPQIRSLTLIVDGDFVIKPHVLIHMFTIKDFYFYVFFLRFLSFFFIFICLFSSFITIFFCFVSYFFCSRLFYQYLFFFFSVPCDFGLQYLLEFSQVLYSSPFYSVFFVPIPNRFLIDSIILNYCILLDLDINILISSEILRLKVLLYFLLFDSKSFDFFSLDLANITIKHFFSPWQFVLPGETSYLFFVEFFLDAYGNELLYFL
jgi:hypothetical protein